MTRLRQTLETGRPLVVFPEGTRGQAGSLKPFSDIFFKLAVDHELPLIPLLIHLDTPFLGPGRENFLTAHRADLKIRLLDAIQPRKSDRSADLARQLHKTMAAAIKGMDRKES